MGSLKLRIPQRLFELTRLMDASGLSRQFAALTLRVSVICEDIVSVGIRECFVCVCVSVCVFVCDSCAFGLGGWRRRSLRAPKKLMMMKKK